MRKIPPSPPQIPRCALPYLHFRPPTPQRAPSPRATAGERKRRHHAPPFIIMVIGGANSVLRKQAGEHAKEAELRGAGAGKISPICRPVLSKQAELMPIIERKSPRFVALPRAERLHRTAESSRKAWRQIVFRTPTNEPQKPKKATQSVAKKHFIPAKSRFYHTFNTF